MNSEVFLNGKSLGVHPYGYTPFSYNLSPYLDINRENVLSVRVDNSNSRTAAGIAVPASIAMCGWLLPTLYILPVGGGGYNPRGVC